jgi:hypothetical protein
MAEDKKLVRLTNKSSRTYHVVAQGKEIAFRPDSSLEFTEAESIKMLQYTGDIIRSEGDKESKKQIAEIKAENRKLIAELKVAQGKVESLENRIKKQEEEIEKLKKAH